MERSKRGVAVRLSLLGALALAACPKEPVGPGAVASVSVTPSTDTLAVGDSVRLVAVPRDNAGMILANQTVTWSSSDPLTAAVSATGTVRAIRIGTAWVRATVGSTVDSARVEIRALVAPAGVREWIGGAPGAPTDWSTAFNWNPAVVPTLTDTARINLQPNEPILSSDVSVGRVEVGPGATVSTSGHDLLASAGALRNGSVTGAGGLVLGGGQDSLSGTLQNLLLAADARATLTGPLVIAESLGLVDSSLLILSGQMLRASHMETAGNALFTLANPADTLDLGRGGLVVRGSSLRDHLLAGVIRDQGSLAGGDQFISSGTKVVFAGGGTVRVAADSGDSLHFEDVEIAKDPGATIFLGQYHPAPVGMLGNLVGIHGKLAVTTPCVVRVSAVSVTGPLSSVAGSALAGPDTGFLNGGSITLGDVTGTANVDGGFEVEDVGLRIQTRASTMLKPTLGYTEIDLFGGTELVLSSAVTAYGIGAHDSASIDLNGHRLTLSYLLWLDNQATLTMTVPADTLDVGTLLIDDGNSSGTLSAGLIRTGGIAANSFTSTGTKVILAGPSGYQHAIRRIQSDSIQFQDLEVACNPGDSERVSGVPGGSGLLRVRGNMSLTGHCQLTTEAPVVIDGDFTVDSSSLFNNDTVQVGHNLSLSGGSLAGVQSSSLLIGGNLTVAADATVGPGGYVEVNGYVLLHAGSLTVSDSTALLVDSNIQLDLGASLVNGGSVAYRGSLSNANDSSSLSIIGYAPVNIFGGIFPKVCAGAIVPGWIETDDSWDPTRCGDPITVTNNVWAVQRFNNLRVGTTLQVCYGLVPAGWVESDSLTTTTCGNWLPFHFVEFNVMRITRLY